MHPPHLPSNQPVAPIGLKLVMFIIWFAIFQGLFIIRLFAVKGLSWTDLSVDLGAVGWVAVGSALVSQFVRWIIVPRINDAAAKLPAMIIGLAMAEGCGIIGMFVVQGAGERNLLFILSVVCVILSAPVYLLKRPQEPSPYRQS